MKLNIADQNILEKILWSLEYWDVTVETLETAVFAWFALKQSSFGSQINVSI